jgi:hypothetical protein
MDNKTYSPAALCRMDRDLVETLASDRGLGPVIAWSSLAVLAGSAMYGAVFGIWRSPLQAGLSALKLPLLIFSVTAVSSLINGMLAQVLGSGLSVRQVWTCILVSLAVSSILLGVLSPVALFFVVQAPASTGPGAMVAYRFLLPAHTAMIGICGIVGNVRAYRLLKGIPSAAPVAGRVLLSWIGVSGLTGCELSWLLSPFLCRPGRSISFFNPDAFTGNFFEYLWRIACGTF